MRIRLFLAAGLLAACSDGSPSTSEPPAQPVAYSAGQSYFGRGQYIEYMAGNAPVIVTAPHGGALAPAEIADRACGTVGVDTNTQETARAIRDAFFQQTGRYPHVVINRLRRGKLDANRDRAEATCGDPRADTAWHEYHAFVDAARAAIVAGGGRGWYLDLHGHGHAKQRLELGYLLSAAQLNLPDAQLDATPAPESGSSIHAVSRASPLPFSALLRGPASLGSLYAAEGFASVPSAADPAPGTDPYFTGGYNTARHTCAGGAGSICGVQVEANFAGVRDTEANRARFAAATVRVLNQYLRTHYDIRLAP